MLRVLRIAHDLGIEACRSPTTSPVEQDLGRRLSATVHELPAAWTIAHVAQETPAVEQPGS
jgi:hypothetical protein